MIRRLHTLLIYGLLVIGSVVFVWPFLWMAATSAKLDRELFGETRRLLPQRPLPRLRSPYVDDRLFEDVRGPRLEETVAMIEQDLATKDYPWPNDIDRATLLHETARGIYSNLLSILPGEAWSWPADQLRVTIAQRVDSRMIAPVVAQLRRVVCIGSLRAQSYDQQEDLLVPAERAATAWQLGGTARAQLLQAGTPNESGAELHYDFSHGETITLTQTFRTTFPLARLHRLQLSLRSDDTWHALKLFVEKNGKRLEAARTWRDPTAARPRTSRAVPSS